MKKVLIIINLLIAVLITSCETSNNYEGYDETDNYDLLDGSFCAEVNYYNPSTGTSSNYTLNVIVEEGYLVKIYWPNGGWLDDDHFSPVSINNRHCTFTSDMGYDYEVNIIGSPCSFTDSEYESYDYQEEEEETVDPDYICPRCGGVKESAYVDYCYGCQDRFYLNDDDYY